MMKMERFLALILSALLLSGCARAGQDVLDGGQVAGTTAAEAVTVAPIEVGEYFSDRDRAGDYDAATAVEIMLSGKTVTCSDKTVQAGTDRVTITAEGVYRLHGEFGGTVIVDAPKTAKVQLVLDGAQIVSASSAAIYVKQADKVFVTLADGSTNRLVNDGSFVAIDENNIDGAIFARDDLTLNGSGVAVIESPVGHGVVAKDELVIAGGDWTVTASGHGFSANDCIALTSATLHVTAGKDGLKAEHDTDAALGYVVVESGKVTVFSDGDGVSASAYAQIVDGEFSLTTGGGHGTVSQSNSGDWSWGFGGGRGEWPGGGSSTGTTTDDVSAKGIKAGGDLLIRGGSFSIDAADDALHSNGNLTVAGGTFALASGDDGIHADAATVITAGTIGITASYEGIEGMSITISGGEIDLVASDDGLNAAGGADGSGFGGFFGGGDFGGRGNGGRGEKGDFGGGQMPEGMPDFSGGQMPEGMPDFSGGQMPEGVPEMPDGGQMPSFGGGDGSMFILISGGKLHVDAGGDGLDSNGTLTVTGGEIYVAGPTNSANGALDYETSATVTGGTLIAVGASGMAENFSSAENQGVIMVNASGKAGDTITLTDASGKVLFNWVSPKQFGSVVISCPGIAANASYTLTAGSQSTTVTLTDSLVSGGGFGGFGGMGGFGGGKPGGRK